MPKVKGMKLGRWFKASSVRIVKKNGRKMLEIRRRVKKPRRRR